jgi:hypothetical protein
MKASPTWLVALAVTAAVQIAVPAHMIIGRERVLQSGQVFKFRTAPIDPYDAFRGRYVALSFEENKAKIAPGASVQGGQFVYVDVETGYDDYARFGLARLDPPADRPYLKLRAGSRSDDTVYLTLPFDRFYMPEDLAPEAERVYRDHTSRSQHDAYVTVRVRDGVGAIENLYVGGRPIADAIRTPAP